MKKVLSLRIRKLLSCLAMASLLGAFGCKRTLDPPSVLFAPPASFMTGGTGPVCVQAADFNGDGKIDLAIANQTSATLTVLLGNGDGTFQTAVSYGLNAGGSLPSALAVGDFNGDGKPDIVVVNASSGTTNPSISVFLNKGDGTFGAANNFATPLSGQSIAVGDINSDGSADLWIGASPKSFVMFGNGDGTFQAAISLATSPSGSGGAMGVAIGDLNNDGKPDLLATNATLQTVGILLNMGGGEFAAVTTVKVQPGPAGLALTDFNHDGNLDMVVAANQFNAGSVQFGNGDGTFQTIVPVSGGSSPVSVVVGGFSSPDNLDLVFPDIRGDGFTFITGSPDGMFGDTFDFPTSPNPLPKPSFAAKADFNGDGRPDLAVVNFSENNVAVLLNQTP